MAEEFQAAICGDSWWNINNSTRSMFPLMMGSTCSVAANNDAGNYSTWHTDFMDLKATTARSCAEETNNNNSFVSNGSLPFPDAQKPQQCESAAASGSTGSILIDSTLQMMGFGLSSSTSSNWNQSLFRCDERPESNFHSVLQEETGIDSSNNSQIQKDWSPKNYSSSGGQVSSVDAAFKPMNQELFSLDQQSLGSVTSTTGGFPIGSASYGYASTLMQGLYDPDPQPQQPQPQPQPQNSLFTNPSSMSYSCATNYGTSSTELSPTWSTVSSLLKQPSSSSSMPPKQQLGGLHFLNNTPFWNASAEALHDIRPGVFSPSSQAQYRTPTFDDKTNCPSALLNKLKREGSPDKASSAGNKSASEPAFKRPRIETPSPLPTFKVRKEKLGDRITALQQLVSPFGKTDTASVLHEAIEYIKFLHDQVNALSTPYKKNGAPIQHQQGCDNSKDSEGPKQDLRSRGLCLVPISSTFPMATETTADFWTPTFGSGALISR